jgi:hypothetical protein
MRCDFPFEKTTYKSVVHIKCINMNVKLSVIFAYIHHFLARNQNIR